MTGESYVKTSSRVPAKSVEPNFRASTCIDAAIVAPLAVEHATLVALVQETLEQRVVLIMAVGVASTAPMFNPKIARAVRPD
jgi:hypothetical protein